MRVIRVGSDNWIEDTAVAIAFGKSVRLVDQQRNPVHPDDISDEDHEAIGAAVAALEDEFRKAAAAMPEQAMDVAQLLRPATGDPGEPRKPSWLRDPYPQPADPEAA